MKTQSSVLALLLSLGLLSVASEADAQQRRRAPRRPAAPAETTDAGASTETTTPDADQPPPTAPTTSVTEASAPAATTTTTSTATPAASSEGDAATTIDPTLSTGPDLAPLRQELTAIMDELVKARARVAIVGKALFKTKVRIILQNRAGDAQSLERIVLRLDGAPIYRKDGGAGLEDGQQVFEGFATPGPHALDLEAEQRSRANDGYGYTLRETLRVAVQKDRLTEITIVLDDDSDMAEDFPEDGEGEYDLRTRVTAATYELEAR